MKSKEHRRVKHYNVRCIVTVMLSVLFTTAYAQRYPFHNLSVDDGLIQSQATCIAQDNSGNLWIGTLGGLSRYDGRNITNFTVRNGLLNNQVRAVATDAEGNIWIGGPTGISRFNGKSFAHFTLQQQSLRGVFNTQQIAVVNDTVWWRAQGDVYYITKGKIQYFVTPGRAGLISSIMVENKGLWVAKEGVLYHYIHNKWDTLRFTLPLEQRSPNISQVFRDKDSLLWVCTSQGLYKIDSNRLLPHYINVQEMALAPIVSTIAQDRAGALWLGTNSGVIKMTGHNGQYYNKHNGLSDNYIFGMLTDAEGNVWMASDGQGVFRYSGTQFTGLDETMGLPSAQVMAIASNKRDSLFLGTYDAGLYIFKDGKVSPLSFPSNPVPAITSMCYTHNSKLWIGTRGRGLWTYQKQTFKQYEAPDRGFPSNFITSLYQDPENRLWIGFASGAMILDNDTFKTIAKDIAVVSFLSIGRDSILIASDKSLRTDNNLQLYTAGTIIPYKTNSTIDSFSVQCFALQGRNIWMGTSDNGVIRYNMDTRKSLVINKSNGLRSDFIYNIVADNEGNIWTGTGFGIHRIRMNDKDEPQVSFFGKTQGVSGMESNMNSVLKLPDGGIWFGTTNGALHYQPHTAVVSSAPRSIVMQSVKLTGESTIERSWYDSTDNWYGIPYHLHLPYQKNNISFTFQAITLSGAQQVLYRYHMDGLETPWSDWSATNTVSYSALPPGNYVFHVQCKGADGQADPELTYAFEIITPFHKTIWFKYAILAACILLGILVQYLYNNRKQRRAKLLSKLRSEEQGKIRMRTAEDFHDEIGNKLTRINVLTSVLKKKLPVTPDSVRILGQIEDNTAQLYSGTRDILWSLKPSNDNLYEILHRIRDFGNELFQDTEVNFAFKGTDEKWRNYRLPMDTSRNLIMIFKEALNNTLKYSKATNVSLEVSLRNRNVLQLVLKDNGEGFDQQTVKRGNGLNNMDIRAERLHGKLYIDSRKNKGTIINLTFKIPLNR
ncbi:MAG: putative signal transduction histidine kinase [Flavipsychrobacter sp.]|nr:putative signal transduction histidine kinase [Flavipsychrobacter sp.]